MGRPSIPGRRPGPALPPQRARLTDLVVSMQERIDQLATEAEGARRKAASERAAREEVLGSEFWRLTKPARSLVDWLKTKRTRS